MADEIDMEEILRRLNGEMVISIMGTPMDSSQVVSRVISRADPERTPEPRGDFSPLVSNGKDEADYPEEEVLSQSSMRELLSNYSSDELLERKAVLYEYGRLFADFTKMSEITQRLQNFDEIFVSFELREQVLILEIILEGFAPEIIKYGRQYANLFPFEESLYNELATEGQLRYLFELCHNCKISQMRIFSQNALNLLKHIINQVIEKYHSYEKNPYFCQTQAAMFSTPMSSRIEKSYLDKLQFLINECKTNEEVFHVLGFFYNCITPINTAWDFNLLTGKHSFIAFFLQEIEATISKEDANTELMLFSVFVFEGVIKERASNTDRSALLEFKLLRSTNYHTTSADSIRKNCLQALLILNNPAMVENLQKKLKNEDEEFVIVEKEDAVDEEMPKRFF